MDAWTFVSRDADEELTWTYLQRVQAGVYQCLWLMSETELEKE